MNIKDKKIGQAAGLRKRAEEIACGNAVRSAENFEALSPIEIQRILQELRVHQIELEMQNEQLRITQEDLETARIRYFDLYDLAPIGYLTISEKGLILEANLTASTLLGVARKALVRQFLTKFILREDQDIFYIHQKQLFNTRTPQVFELRMMRAGDTLFWARMEANEAKDSDGMPVCRVVMSDITEQKQEHIKFENLIVHQDALLAAIPDIIMEVDINKVYTWANQSGIDFFGEDIIGREASFFFEGEQQTYQKVQPLFNGSEDVFYVESWQRRKDGEKRLLAWVCRNLKDTSGIVFGALSSAKDITERNKAELLQKESEEKYRLLIENSGIGVGVYSLDGRILLFNQKAMENLGGKVEDYIGKSLMEVFDKQEASLYIKRIQDVVKCESSLEYEDNIHTPSGDYWLLSNHTAIKNPNGKIIGVQVIAHDITKRKLAENGLMKKTEELKNLNSYFIDREIQMIELKNEINELLVKSGGKEKYVIHTK
jgi:PAS domain S-box-containing protein